jgi:Ca-activated chloride channel family protein
MSEFDSAAVGGVGFLSGRGGEKVPFLGIDAAVEIDAATSRTSVTQRWRNAESRAIEATYSFPLPEGASLLSLDVILGERRLRATVSERCEAERRYEDAIDAGDTAVLLEHVGDGLRSLSLGNLLPGEEAEIVLRFASINRWEDGRLRWTLPTTVAPRYGRRTMAPHQLPMTDAAAEHRASFVATVSGSLSGARIFSPSHVHDVETSSDGVATCRFRDFAMDRDVVLDVELGASLSGAIVAPDGDGEVAWACFVPRFEASERSGRDVKIVLDCSGSMQGDSIAAARQALERVIWALRPEDTFNLVRFGSSADSMFPSQVPASKENVRIAEACARSLRADMGGTEIGAALRMAYASKGRPGVSGDVILVTDGQAWGTDALVSEAKSSGHRIFAIGVGNAVQRELIGRLSDETGGRSELVVPGEAVAGAISRQFARLKGGRVDRVRIEWPSKPSESAPLPSAAFSGESLLVSAVWSDRVPSGVAVLSFRREDGTIVRTELDLSAAERRSDDSYARLSASARLDVLLDRWNASDDVRGRKSRARSKALRLALGYSLLCPLTALVTTRENEEAALGVPELRRVGHMAPAGMAMLSGAGLSAAALVGGSLASSTALAVSAVSSCHASLRFGASGSRSATRSFGGFENASVFPEISHCVSDLDESPSFSLAADSFCDAAFPSDAESTAFDRFILLPPKNVSEIARANERWRPIESELFSSGCPEGLAWLSFLSPSAKLLSALEALAGRFGERIAVRAWVAACLLCPSASPSMAGRALAEEFAKESGSEALREAGRLIGVV